MRRTTLTILGIALDFEYTIYEPTLVEWSLTPESRGPRPLLEILLRVHYNQYIEAQLREHWFREEYEAHQIAAIERFDDPEIPF